MAAPIPASVFRKPWFGKARYFVSHAYQDTAAREALVANLPAHVTPFIFPEILVTPEQRVSDDLVREVRNSKGVVYIEGGASAASFWVAFERRLALGLGMPVIAFDPIGHTFAKTRARAVNPPCAFIWNEADARDSRIVASVSRWLIAERALDLTASLPRTGLPGTQSEIRDTAESLRDKLDSGGLLVLFLSEAALARNFAALQSGAGHAALANRDTLDRRTLIVWTEAPQTERVASLLMRAVAGPGFAGLRDAILASMSDGERGKPIHLTSDGRMDWRRADDLMVRIEYLAYRIGGAGRLFTEDHLTIFDDFRGRPVVDRPGTW